LGALNKGKKEKRRERRENEKENIFKNLSNKYLSSDFLRTV
jgi:hypothetical protein